MTEYSRLYPDVNASVLAYLQSVQYDIGGGLKYLKDNFPGLRYVSGYPDDVTALKFPTLAVAPGDIQPGEIFYGEARQGGNLNHNIWGFVLGQGKESDNRLYRDRLMSDLQVVFGVIALDAGITVIDSSSQLATNEAIEVVSVVVRPLPVTAPEIAAERFKFVVELALSCEQ